MTKRTLEFWVEKRFVYEQHEWALFCRCIDAPDPHKRESQVLKTWTKDPSKKQVKETIDLIRRSMDFAKEVVLVPEEIQVVEYSSLEFRD